MSCLDIQFAKAKKSGVDGFTSYSVTFNGFDINVIQKPRSSQETAEIIENQEKSRKISFDVKDKGNSKYELKSDAFWEQIPIYHVEVTSNKTIVKHVYPHTALLESTYTITETKDGIECSVILASNGQPVQPAVLGYGKSNTDAICRGAVLTGLFAKMMDHEKESAEWDFVENEKEEWDEIDKDVDLDGWMD